MTNEQSNPELSTPDFTFQWPGFADGVIRTRDVVQEVAKAGKTAKEAVAWMHNTTYDVLLKKVGSAKKFVEDIKALGASEATQNLYREQLAQCAVMRDVWAPVVKSVKKNYNIDEFADYAGEILGEWWGKSEMPRETNQVLALLHQAVFVAYQVQEAGLAGVIEEDEALPEELRNSFLAVLQCYRTAAMGRDALWDGDEEDDDDDGEEDGSLEPLGDDVWKRFSAGMTPIQTGEFVLMFSLFFPIWGTMEKIIANDRINELMMEGFSGLAMLLQQANLDKTFEDRITEIKSLADSMTDEQRKTTLASHPKVFAEALTLRRLTENEQRSIVKSLSICCAVPVMFSQLPQEAQTDVLKTAKIVPGLMQYACELAADTAKAIKDVPEPWAVMKNPEVPQD